MHHVVRYTRWVHGNLEIVKLLAGYGGDFTERNGIRGRPLACCDGTHALEGLWSPAPKG